MSKKVKQLEEQIKLLNKEIHEIKKTLQEMWDETHPPVMGGK